MCIPCGDDEAGKEDLVDMSFRVLQFHGGTYDRCGTEEVLVGGRHGEQSLKCRY